MTKIKRLTLFLIGAAAAIGCSAAMAWDDFPEQYLARKDTVTLGAGNDQNVNTATQMIDPWPLYVGDRRIPANGERMVGAVNRYRDVSKLGTAPKPMTPLYSTTRGISGGGGGGQ